MTKVFDIWAKRYPRPSDKLVYNIYSDYMKLQKNILTSYTFGVATDRIDDLDLQLDTARLKFIKDAKGRVTPIISLRPTFDQAIMTKLEFYHRFFEVYNVMCDNISTLVNYAIDARKTPLTEVDKGLIHYLVVLTQILAVSMKQNRLSKAHLELIAKRDFRAADKYDAMIREMGLDASISAPFAMMVDGCHFFHYPKSTTIGSWFEYVEKMRPIVAAAFKEQALKRDRFQDVHKYLEAMRAEEEVAG